MLNRRGFFAAILGLFTFRRKPVSRPPFYNAALLGNLSSKFLFAEKLVSLPKSKRGGTITFQR